MTYPHEKRGRLVAVAVQHCIDSVAYSVDTDDLGLDIIADPPFPHNYRVRSAMRPQPAA